MPRSALDQFRAALASGRRRLGLAKTGRARISRARISRARISRARISLTRISLTRISLTRTGQAATRLARSRRARRPAALAVIAALAAAGIAVSGVVAVAGSGAPVPGKLTSSFASPATGALEPGLSVLADVDRAVDGPGSSSPSTAGDRPAGNPAAGATPRSGSSPQARATPAGTRPARQPAHPGTASRGQAQHQSQASRHSKPQPSGHGRPAAPAPRTSCRTVAHIGDSTSVDLISPASLPDPGQRLQATYARVGVQHLRISASGGRSIVEEMPGQANGYVVARAWHDAGYHGCWVFALGTNDAADISAGSEVGMLARIERMMSEAHGEPVLWVNTRTELSAGPWAQAHEQAWDDALHQTLARYPNMRIFNWAAVAQPGWFLPDGIHYNSAGCADRARAIADALARAFPLHGHSASHVVG
jgi:hypothetical protein